MTAVDPTVRLWKVPTGQEISPAAHQQMLAVRTPPCNRAISKQPDPRHDRGRQAKIVEEFEAAAARKQNRALMRFDEIADEAGMTLGKTPPAGVKVLPGVANAGDWQRRVTIGAGGGTVWEVEWKKGSRRN
ncbi:MAG TPA: hypothetical protein VGI93_06270 [Steroidobacteraceae bacterium]